jgi:hypothetical protein
MRYASIDPRLAQLALLVILVAGLALVGKQAGEWVMSQLDFRVLPSTEPLLHRMVMTAIAVYILLMAMPFCPGIEIGLGLIMLFGAPIVPLVYGATVVALMIAFLVGRFVPPRLILHAFDTLRLRRTRDVLRRMEPLDESGRLTLLQGSSSSRVLRGLLRHRYVAVAIALNTPGNIVLGDGGGIALAAGFSRLFSLSGFAITVILAVAPVPLAILLTEG